MNTNRLENVADRQRVSHVRDLFFVILVAMILVFQLISLSQARATSSTYWLLESETQSVDQTKVAECQDAALEAVAALPSGSPLC